MQNSCPIPPFTSNLFRRTVVPRPIIITTKSFVVEIALQLNLEGKSCAISRWFPKRKKIPSDRIYLQTQLCSSRPSWTAHLQKKKRIASNRTRLMGEKEFSSEPLPSRNRCTRGCARLRRHFRHRAITSLTF